MYEKVYLQSNTFTPGIIDSDFTISSLVLPILCTA